VGTIRDCTVGECILRESSGPEAFAREGRGRSITPQESGGSDLEGIGDQFERLKGHALLLSCLDPVQTRAVQPGEFREPVLRESSLLLQLRQLDLSTRSRLCRQGWPKATSNGSSSCTLVRAMSVGSRIIYFCGPPPPGGFLVVQYVA